MNRDLPKFYDNEELENDPKFMKFLEFVELDHVKFFPDETFEKPKTPKRLKKLEMNDFIKYSYILARRLEREEEFRLQTEEQYQLILEQQMMAHQQIEQREKILKEKLKDVLGAKPEEKRDHSQNQTGSLD